MVEIDYKNKDKNEIEPTDSLFNKYVAVAEKLFGGNQFNASDLSEFDIEKGKYGSVFGRLEFNVAAYLSFVEEINRESYGIEVDDCFVARRTRALLEAFEEPAAS